MSTFKDGFSGVELLRHINWKVAGRKVEKGISVADVMTAARHGSASGNYPRGPRRQVLS